MTSRSFRVILLAGFVLLFALRGGICVQAQSAATIAEEQTHKFATTASSAQQNQAANNKLHLVGAVPSSNGIIIDRIEGIVVLNENPNEIVFVTINMGAQCGGGTPATAWKMTLNASTGDMISVVQKQSLSAIQMIRGALFESSDGKLFTGGGWCGYKPPYFSTDGGETWRTANRGVSPPNSSFSLVEFKGDVYIGTGYEPWPAQVYRWLGDSGPNNWELVLTIPAVRSILSTMVVYKDQLFVGSLVYGYSGVGCSATVPVYVSDDGKTFTPTTGIPSCFSVDKLLVLGDQLIVGGV